MGAIKTYALYDREENLLMVGTSQEISEAYGFKNPNAIKYMCHYTKHNMYKGLNKYYVYVVDEGVEEDD